MRGVREPSLAVVALVLGAAACAGAAGPARDAPDRAAATAAASPPRETRPATATATVEPDAPPEAPPPAAPPKKRITSRGYTTWIWPKPRTSDSGGFLGYVRFGHAIALRAPERVAGAGCSGGFWQVEPRGYVCSDATVTDAPDETLTTVSAATESAAGSLPYRYALSGGAPMYNRVPTAAEQRRFEAKYGPRGRWEPLRFQKAHEDLAVAEPIAASDPAPPFATTHAPIVPGRMGLVRQELPRGSMLSFAMAFAAEGRTWLLSTDATLVPADRVRAFRPSPFAGVRLGEELALPIAWIRTKPRPRYVESGGAVVRADGEWPVRTFVRLSGRQIDRGTVTFLETAEKTADGAPLYVAASDASVVRAEEKLPFRVAADQKWVLVRIGDGTLVAYEGLTPVFSTLISPGRGGQPVPGRDPVEDGTTPVGTWTLTFKDRAATMSPDKGDDRTFWIADVPWTQYFNPPFALHAAYWHERFGDPTSGGCVNLSPKDAELLFGWTDPKVPDDWQGATGAGAPDNGKATMVVIRR